MTDLLTDKKRSKFQISLMKNLTQLLKHALKLMLLSKEKAAKNGLIHVDGKKEFALGPGRKVVLVDTFGTLDEDRLVGREKYAEGEQVELSKEFVELTTSKQVIKQN